MEETPEHLPALVHIFNRENATAETILCAGDFLIFFVQSGIFRVLIDGNKVMCTSGELVIAVSREYYQVLNCSKKVLCYFVKVQRQFIVDTKMFYHFVEAFVSKSPVRLFPDEFDSKVMVRIIKLLGYFYSTKANPIRFSVHSYTAAVSLLVFQAGWQYGNSVSTAKLLYNRREALAMGFLKLLVKHFKKEHSLSFYSGVLCVTDGYLNKSVKEVTGKTVGHCVAEIIVSEAKYLLAQYDHSIETISEQLGFTSAGSFSRYFKKHAFLTPTAYRRDLQL
jgi:AraC-like DNA-binding protein